jgi:hypothetical protein
MRVTKGTAYITMDVCLRTLDGTPSNIIEIEEFGNMIKGLTMAVPDMPTAIMTGIVDKNCIVVACMELWK